MLKSLFSKISPFLIVKEAKAGAKKITANEQRLVDFCALTPEEALARLKSSATGLNHECVCEARAEFPSGFTLWMPNQRHRFVAPTIVPCRCS